MSELDRLWLVVLGLAIGQVVTWYFLASYIMRILNIIRGRE